jgi:hypothetical protein
LPSYVIRAYELRPRAEGASAPLVRARGIAAEPPVGADLCVCPKGDGADSPTRAGETREAARPKEFCFAKFNEE